MMSSNQQEIPFIKLNKEEVQNFIDLIHKQYGSKPIIEYRYNFIKETSKVLIPLNQKHFNEIKSLLEEMPSIDYKIIYGNATINPKFKYKTIEDVLKVDLPNWPSHLIPKSYDIIGSIAIVEFANLNNFSKRKKLLFKKSVAKAITIVNRSINSVYEKVSQIQGKYRLRKLKLLYGIDNPETIHKENYAIFKINVKKAYFTPRLVNERKKIANSPIDIGELIVDMFAGVGPFSIQIAMKHNVKIYAFDINTDAYRYLKENISLNQVESKIFPYNIDSKKLLESGNQLGTSLKGKIDRIIMNLPEKSLEFLDVACFLLKKKGGTIHNYQFSPKPNSIELAIEKFNQYLTHYQYQIKKIIRAEIVKSYSPSSELISLDIKVTS